MNRKHWLILLGTLLLLAVLAAMFLRPRSPTPTPPHTASPTPTPPYTHTPTLLSPSSPTPSPIVPSISDWADLPTVTPPAPGEPTVTPPGPGEPRCRRRPWRCAPHPRRRPAPSPRHLH